MVHTRQFAAIALMFCMLLTACGGGSGGSHKPEQTTITGAVSAAPVKDAAIIAEAKYFTTQAQQEFASQAPIEVGRSDAEGKIVFNTALFDKLDRSQNAILYSEGGVRFSSEFTTVQAMKDANAPAQTHAFNGRLRAVLPKGSNEVYLTIPNTLVADMVEQGEPLVEAQKVITNIIRNQLRLTAMEDLFGDPLVTLTETEVISQALLQTADLTEERFAAAPVVIDSYTPDRFNPTLVAQRVKSVLGTKVDEAVLNTDVMVDKTPVPYRLGYSAGGELVKVGSKLCVLPVKISASNMLFNVWADMSDKSKGYFMLAAVSGDGYLFFGGNPVELNKPFNGSTAFSCSPSATLGSPNSADIAAFTTASFTFAATDEKGNTVPNVNPLTVTIRKASDNECIVIDYSFAIANANAAIEFNNIIPSGATARDTAQIKDNLTLNEKSKLPLTYTAKVNYMNSAPPSGDTSIKLQLTAPQGFAFVRDSGTPGSSTIELPVSPIATDVYMQRTTSTRVHHVIAPITARLTKNGKLIDFSDNTQRTSFGSAPANNTTKGIEQQCAFAPENRVKTIRDFTIVKEGRAKVQSYSSKLSIDSPYGDYTTQVEATFTSCALELAVIRNGGKMTKLMVNNAVDAPAVNRFHVSSVRKNDIYTEAGTVSDGIGASNDDIAPMESLTPEPEGNVARLVFNFMKSTGVALGNSALSFQSINADDDTYILRIYSDEILNNMPTFTADEKQAALSKLNRGLNILSMSPGDIISMATTAQLQVTNSGSTIIYNPVSQRASLYAETTKTNEATKIMLEKNGEWLSTTNAVAGSSAVTTRSDMQATERSDGSGYDVSGHFSAVSGGAGVTEYSLYHATKSGTGIGAKKIVRAVFDQ
ncbi:hypothetical protein [Halodesulfovibrio sp.]|uniref:hypothetical protein n=1 Tax=Halodesulfovibrio sp. TaxID=1912772 RepID=UPI0025D5E3BC|nr:hypothetical protein [Halodesulfovibrio sp.]MCT4534081.1 hypothetical protein [Halodesulfovibrio sp.]